MSDGNGIERRDFLKVLGVSGAGASVFGCSTDEVERLIPYVVPPEDSTPGLATWYTSVCRECPAECGLWVKTREGRPVKVDGNPGHPVSGGALCARGHSSLQGLYDPDRVSGPMLRENGELREIDWEEARAILADRLAGAANPLWLGGRTGPSTRQLVDDFMEAVGGERVEYEALSEAPLREAARQAFGRDAVPTYDFAQADLVVSFGADFLETWLSPVEHARGFAQASTVNDEGVKAPFVFLGPRLSLTGQNADEWYPIQAGSEPLVAMAVARAMQDMGADAGPYEGVVQGYDVEQAADAAGVSADKIQELAERLMEADRPLVAGPGVAGQHRHATAANLAVLVVNAMAGALGETVRFSEANNAAPSEPFASVREAVDAMQGGDVDVLLLHRANPVYSLPPDSGFREALDAVDFTVAFASHLDETTSEADLVLPDRHALEAWGDSNPRAGVYGLQQPTTRPIPHFDSQQAEDVLLELGQELGHDLGAEDFQAYLQERWSEVHQASEWSGEDFETFWRRALRDGVVPVPDEEEDEPELQEPDRAFTFDPPPMDGESEGLALVVQPSAKLWDGRLANRPWMQELPDVVSKMAWHSWVELHPDTADELGVQTGDVVRVQSPQGELEVPVWTYPGIRPDTASLTMGNGHERMGRYADGHGVNPMRLLPADAEEPSGTLVHVATRVQVEPTGEYIRPASIEGEAQTFDRPIVPAVEHNDLLERETSGETPRAGEHPGASEDQHLYELQAWGGFVPVPTDGSPGEYPLEGAQYGEYDPETQPRWAMAIDLDKCTGCSACVTACQSENNVGVVGEDQIRMGRDLHWIRPERYYEHVDATQAGTVDIRHLPMLCQHCGNAPCEPVCPVYAAYSTPDGINAQVYNRCVGTRYCANNCPYKIRVFNWYSSYNDPPEPLNWQYNPDVTVRSEGVMEKCTFCVQRIREGENKALLEGRELEDGDVVPACQQSCPAEAIVFGDIRDPESRVAQVSRSHRTYRVMDGLINTQPAVNYLKKVTFHEVEDIHGV